MSQTQVEARSTTGTMCMWKGTTDGEEGYLDRATGKTNILPWNEVKIHVKDLRDVDPKPTVKTHGYQLMTYPTSIPTEVFKDAHSPENKRIIESAYFQECQDLVKKTTGAAEAITFVFRTRAQNTDMDSAVKMKGETHTSTLPTAHVDRDHTTAPERLRSSLGVARAADLMKKYKRWGCTNVWRSISPTVQRWPLCFVNHEGIPDWSYDTHMGRVNMINDTSLSFRGIKSHEAILKPDSRYEYYYASNMTNDEVLLFHAFHSDPASVVPHGAFMDDNTAPDAPPRFSLEVRTWVFFED
ncbi:hypothetical protein F4778DRAFT_54438 [Xylariomycetidae sp. FL2044]|nr:hypothetical protein F4778DRAFT_54438 [Xylariomycetidae sp. FL2044]